MLANYIRDNSPVTPTADGNWSFAPIDTVTDITVVFRVPNTDRARNFVAAQLQNAEFIEVNDAGEAVYELILNQ